MYQIFIQFLIGMAVLTLDVNQNDWVRAVKAKIQDKTGGIHPDHIRLYWYGEEILDDRTLGDYRIEKEDTLQLVFAAGAMQSWTSDEDTCRLYYNERTMYVISGSESTGRMTDYEWNGEYDKIFYINKWLEYHNRFYIQTLVFDAGVTHIGDYSFVGCDSLHTVYNYATTPQNINSSVFASTDILSCTLYVPESSVSLYETADIWKDFGSIQALPAPITSGTCGDNLTWSLDTDSGVLLITGSGAMDSYSDYSDVPWSNYRIKIRTLSLPAGITAIGSYAFSGCYG
ncbi:MAG: leucine-rich repeat protein [Paludibacteraceae bacterium]|nr:leucine-rich repeat protein [Paludibacteraceae bacterium]